MASSPDFNWNTEQRQAIDRIRGWADKSESGLQLSLTGAAGTGKTTVLKAIQPFLQNQNVCWAAMTGKAALRMHEVTGVEAKTLHSVLYQRPNKGKNNRLFFNSVKAPDCKFLVVDEASMMPPKIYNDLQSWQMNGVRILYVGDGFQLPPILDYKEIKEYGDDFSIFKEVVGPSLKQVMRSGDDIITVATQLREENHVPKQNVGESYKIRRSKTPGRDACADFLADNDNHVLITWRNKMRMQANRLIRRRLGFDGVLPHKGEPVMICKNGHDWFNKDETVLNGEIHWADYFTDGPKLGPEVDTMKFVTDLGINLLASTQGRVEPMDGSLPNIKDWKEYMKHFKIARVPDPVPITYGYVSTAHKAQGSEYSKVTIFLSADDMQNPHFKKDTVLPDGTKMSFATVLRNPMVIYLFDPRQDTGESDTRLLSSYIY
jgi:ATP-dependent exoDNAse (exonuclease V) alpha subunit